MGRLIGKLKKGDNYYNITTLDSGSLYGLSSDISLVQYDCRYKLEDDEWFKIDEFSKKDYGIIVGHLGNTVDFNQLKQGKYKEIAHLVFMDGDTFYFEKITDAKILRRQVLDFSDEPALEKAPKVIALNNKPDAIYDKEKDTLCFRTLNTLKDIFNGIEILYREATDEETQKFMLNSCVELGANFTIKSIKPANRGRITMAWKNYQNWSQELKDDFIIYAHKYCPDIECTDDKFTVNNEKELKHVLYAMDERYYTTELQEEKRLANSVQTLDIE